MTTIDRRNLLLGGITATTLSLPQSAKAETTDTSENFSFCALGDTCYDVERDHPTYMKLIDEINAHQPSFTIHVGDTKGAGSCGEETQQRVYNDFQRFEGPLIYTPGDNEWVDWFLEVNGRGNPLEALALIRKIFFKEAFSLGQTKMPLIRQADVSPHKDMVENAIWSKNGVTFGTVHIPGTNNGYAFGDGKKSPEFDARHEANLDWIASIFATAKAAEAKAAVLAFHADWFREIDYEPNAFLAVDEVIRQGAADFEKPVLLIHGDLHIFVIDRPYHQKGKSGSWGSGYNVTRLQPYGAPQLKAVMVSVDLSAVDPFSFKTVSVPQVHRL